MIVFFARHPVAGNLLMLSMLMFGVWGLTKLNRQVLPDFDLDIISITVQWPGSSPEDVESNILEALEPEVRFLDGVERVDGVASFGRAEVSIRFEDGANISKALTDVQAAVARISTFPVDIEQPIVSQLVQSDEVCRIELTGPYSESALKIIAKQIRDDLLDRGMSRVTLVGARKSEITVEVTEDVLRRLDLTVDDLAARIDRASLNLPSGTIESGGVSRQIRTEALARTARDVGKIEVVSGATGEKLYIEDIARIKETFEDGAVSHVRNGQTSVGLVVRRSRGLDSIEAQQMLIEYLDGLRGEMPPTLSIDMFDVFADQATQRVRMLLNNGFGGLLLVMAVLYIFLNARVAFWVAMGIPISIMAALGGMAMMGMTLNMISMFAIIMGLGIIVDDAIVIGEHTEMLHRHGMSPEEATMTAAKVMFAPVLAASLTTIAAFFPILTIGNEIGRIIRELPLTVILVIFASLAECFLVLPMHLKKALERMERRPAEAREPRGFRLWFVQFRDNQFSNAVAFCFARRGSTVLTAVCALIISFTLLGTGRVGFEFFASPEVDMVFGNFTMVPGSPRKRTETMMAEVERAAHAVEDRLTNGAGGLIFYEFGTIGTTEGRMGDNAQTGDHAGAYTVELVSSDNREVRTYEFMAEWQKEIRPIAGTQSYFVFERSAGGPPGRDLDIRLHGAGFDVLKAGSMDIRSELKNLPGVSAVEDNLPFGMQEIIMEITPAGLAKGFTNDSVARQVRNAFEGAIAKRFSQDQEEIILRVRLAAVGEGENRSIRDIYLRTPDGVNVPLTEVVTLKTRVGYSQIRREDGLRQISVVADVDPTISTTNDVLAEVERSIAPQVKEKFGINLDFKGKAEEQREAIGDTLVALGLAVMMMYVILAWVFSSYRVPFIVMSIIPFGLVGALIGHWVLGYRVNMLSLQALLGLSGVMINDAIIIVTSIRRRISEGMQFDQAVIQGARERLRPVLLTTLTTIGGLMPLLFERSMQAQLVQPLAVTLIFGLLFSPFLVLFFVPALLGLGNDMISRRDQPLDPDAPGASLSTT